MLDEESEKERFNKNIIEAELEEQISWHKTDYANLPGSLSINQRFELMFMLNEPSEKESFEDYEVFEE